MMVKSETADHLVMEHTPWAVRFFTLLFTAICIGVAYRHYYHLGNTGWAITFVVVAIILAFGFINSLQRLRLTMDRASATATVRASTPFGTTEQVFALEDVIRAKVDRKRATDGSSANGRHVVRRAVLEVEGQDEPVSLAMNYQSGSHATVTTSIINDWLAGKSAE